LADSSAIIEELLGPDLFDWYQQHQKKAATAE
jgi:hypothetical protein